LRRPFFFALLVVSGRLWNIFGSAITIAGLQHPRKTVDGVQQTLEIPARSSYVPSLPYGVRSRWFRKMCVKHGAVTCPEIATWMK
jgi:hypothetical protein